MILDRITRQAMVLVGFMGTKGSGKSAASSYLVNKYNYVEKSFAEPLKKACQELFLLNDDQVFGTQLQKETPDPRWDNCTPRQILQYVGTDLLRDQLNKLVPSLDKNIFIYRFKLWYDAEIQANKNLCVVISDVRFQNEIEIIRSMGGIVIKLDRPGAQPEDTHQSEIEMASITNYNYLIRNTGTIQDLHHEIDKCISF